MECQSCGAQIDDSATQCLYCNAAVSRITTNSVQSGPGTPTQTPISPPNKVTAGICGIFFGCLGVHKFILGYQTAGCIMLGITVFTGGLAALVFAPIGLIEGIIYLTKSDQDFLNTYVVNKKEWF